MIAVLALNTMNPFGTQYHYEPFWDLIPLTLLGLDNENDVTNINDGCGNDRVRQPGLLVFVVVSEPQSTAGINCKKVYAARDAQHIINAWYC